MNRIKLQRYETAIYLTVFLLAIILGLLANFAFPEGTVKALLINLSSELIAVGLLFFFLKRLFLLEDGPSSNRAEEYMSMTRRIVDRQNKEYLQAIDLAIKEIQNLKDAEDRNAKILSAIQAESSLADKIKERMEINDKLTSLASQLKNTEFLLSEKEHDQRRTSEWLTQKVSVLTDKLNSLEFAFNKNIYDIGNELRNRQELAIENFRKVVSSRETVNNVSNEVNRNLPVLIRPSNLDDNERIKEVSEAISKKIVGTYMGKVTETLDQLDHMLTDSYDSITTSKKDELFAELNEIKRQIQELNKEIQ